MPGIVGMFDAPAQRPQGRAPFDLARADGLGWTALHDRPGALLGVLERPRPPAAGSVHEREGMLTVLYGHCLDPRGRGALDAAAAAELLEREGEGVLDRLEGGFHLVRLDTAANRLTLMNDRLASLPCFWHRRPGLFCFGPQIRNLPPIAAAGPLDPTAALFFLSIGH